MKCPYCDAPLKPDDKQCGECHLTFSKACGLFGVAPRISRDVYDSTYNLSWSTSTTIQSKMDRMFRKFPELDLKLVVHSFPPAHPLKTYTFWLFNAAELSSSSRRGGKNHTVLILIDPARREASLMPGYGLEQILDYETMDSLLAGATPRFREDQFLEGVDFLLNGLDAHFESKAEPAMDWQVESGEF